MFPTLPEDVINAARAAFADANDRVSQLLVRQPAMHEEGLDFHLVSRLDEQGAQILPSGTALVIETHWGSLHESALCVRQARTNSERHGSVVRRQADFGMVESCL